MRTPVWSPLVLALVAVTIARIADAHEGADWDDGSYTRVGAVRVYVACGFHGREWATVELCKAMEAEVRRRVAAANRSKPFWTQWFFDSDVNPEGTRAARTEGNECQRGNARGVDINRNFPPIERCPSGMPPARPPLGVFVGRDSEDYPGERPLSEHETRAIVSNMREFRPDVALFIHTGTVAIMQPYDSCFEPTPGKYNLMMTEFASKMADVLGLKKWQLGRSTTRLHPGVGTASDYAFAHLDVPFTFTIETYEMPSACPRAGEILRKPTSRMTPAECRLAFVPHTAADNCARPNLQAYIARWIKIVDAMEYVVGHDPKEREYLSAWLEKTIVPYSELDKGGADSDDDDDGHVSIDYDKIPFLKGGKEEAIGQQHSGTPESVQGAPEHPPPKKRKAPSKTVG